MAFGDILNLYVNLTGNFQGLNEVIFVTGSIYMLGDARSFWEPKIDVLKKLEF